MTYKNLNLDEIIKWCQENGEVDWLKAKAKETVRCKVYPKKKVVDENGKVHTISDKDAKPKTEVRPIPFVSLKVDFVAKFMPELMPKKKDKATTMYERIANL